MPTTDPATDAQTQASPVAYPQDEPGRVATPDHRLRREVLKGAVGTVIGAAVVYLGWTRYLFPPAPPAPPTGIPLGKVAEFPAGSPPKVVQGTGTTRPYIVENTGGDTFRVRSAVCTHQGCTVGWEAKADAFVCPCHGAHFDITGRVTRGPAALPLAAIPAHVSGDTLYAQG